MKIAIYIQSLVVIGFLSCLSGCSGDLRPDSGQMMEESEFSTVSGTIRDARTDRPIPGALVTMLDLRVESEVDGKYAFSPVNQLDVPKLKVEALDYMAETRTFLLTTEDVTVDVVLTPLTDPESEIRKFLTTFSTLMQTMNVDNIEELFTEDFLASDDLMTRFFGIDTGAIPVNFESVIPTVKTLFEEFSSVQFRFHIVQMNVTNTRKAFAQLEVKIVTEKAPRSGRREIISECEIYFRKESSKWKMFFWKFVQADVRL